jgi:hypothetical protein
MLSELCQYHRVQSSSGLHTFLWRVGSSHPLWITWQMNE